MNEYQNIEASILRWASDFAEQVSALSGPPMVALNLDAYANPKSWPEQDFIGVSELMINLPAGGLPSAKLAYVISTRDDPNLHRMSSLVNMLVNALHPPAHITLLNSSTGVEEGKLHVLGNIKVDATVETETQPAKPVFVSLRSDQQFGR